MRALRLVLAMWWVGCTSGIEGPPGPAGPKGDPGTTGTSATVEFESPGTNCAHGGVKVTSASGLSYVCNGAPGQNGSEGASVTTSVEPAGGNCTHGGVKLTSASGATYVCSGSPGPAGTSATHPLGAIIAFAGQTPPAGWLLCDGSLLAMTTYPELFAVIGSTYGGDGRNSFALPDLRGRAAFGAGQGPGLTARALGETFGSETHQLLVSEMPAHTHPVDDPGHSHTIGGQFGAGHWTVGGNNLAAIISSSNNSTSTDRTGITVFPAGGSQSFPIVPPAVVINYLIKH